MAKYEFDPNNELGNAINRARRGVDDLGPVFKLMAAEWFKSNRSIFDPGRKSRGKYKDLSDQYKKAKKARHGFVYPILLAGGKLARSMTDPTSGDSVQRITKKDMILGTRVTSKRGAPYPIFLHKGTAKMPARPVVLLGAEQVATRQINMRRKAWIDRLDDFITQQTPGKKI
jgi:hypothetical protein